MLDEAERSLHDALCVLSQTVKDSRVVYGGGYPEMQARTLFLPCVKGLGVRPYQLSDGPASPFSSTSLCPMPSEPGFAELQAYV